ncbi:conserved hypothetical protein [Perkinsus marinus ATCC 50983]|uniref:Sphingomyelin synthase-like domain-containing protein n=1 Tax=Perkinsus marinus (strain ATCC 50983 / TXsc) TaxID=423536 RepID=C5LM36_PERM5|nr:conserved hypothetical protein [Perkinsus marinus ATCC 50983]EER02167.1 conserved hypothetical protein [Perkinsus marinus ATCC 50983]|eukprot:XP_002769449.1 conserved hypothetical protein [Perkinsus marinus ATCC 50983]
MGGGDNECIGTVLHTLKETETDGKVRPVEPIKIVKTQVFVREEAAQKEEEEDKRKKAQLLRCRMDVMKDCQKGASIGIGKYLAASHKRKSHGAASGEEGRGPMLGQMENFLYFFSLTIPESIVHLADPAAETNSTTNNENEYMDQSLARVESQAAYANMNNSSKARTYFARVLRKSRIEWEVFKVAWPWIVIGIIFQILHDWAHNWVYYLSGKYNVYGGPENALVDFGHMAFPDIDTLTVSPAPENPVLYTCMFLAVAFVVIAPIFGDRDDFTLIGAIWRVLNVCDFTILFRCISFLVTILPAPAPHCQEAPPPNAPLEPFFSPPTSAGQVLSGFDVQNGCGDLVFSSHMMYCLLATLVVTHYSRSLVLMVIEWLLCCALVCLIWRKDRIIRWTCGLVGTRCLWFGYAFTISSPTIQ